jgi:hypothetical protein
VAQTDRPGAAKALCVLALGGLSIACACSSSHTAGPPDVPSATLATATATRRYLAGPGADVLKVHMDAGAVIAHHDPVACQADGRNLASLGNPVALAGVLGGLPDVQLAELAADELSSLGAVLGSCQKGPPVPDGLQQLSLTHDTITKRLRADGLKR